MNDSNYIDPDSKSLSQTIGGLASNVFNRTLGRLLGANLQQGAESPLRTRADASWTRRDAQTDWRVRLTVPTANTYLRQILFGDGVKQDKIKGGTKYNLLSKLSDTGGILFPLTPNVIVQHQAAYNPMATVHNNFPFYAYQNSETSNMTIVGEFPVQNQDDAQSWVATLHFLRTVTKMFFGGDEAQKGSPPPILLLNGYGQHVFKNIPVVVTNFTVELTNNVDYICTSQGASLPEASETAYSSTSTRIPETWAPSSSIFTVQIQPVYSREAIKNFSLQDFASGKLTGRDSGNNIEQIGFI